MIKNVIKIVVGTLMLICVLIGYIPQQEYWVELTCISNMLGGWALVVDGILNLIKKKNIPNAFYLNVTVSILMVFFVCMGSLTGMYKFNFKDAFFFMHVVTPIIFAVCYMFFCDENKRKIKSVLSAPIMSMAYFLFDYIRCQFTGNFVYGFVEPEEVTFLFAIVTGAILYIFLSLFGLGLFAMNRRVHKNSN